MQSWGCRARERKVQGPPGEGGFSSGWWFTVGELPAKNAEVGLPGSYVGQLCHAGPLDKLRDIANETYLFRCRIRRNRDWGNRLCARLLRRARQVRATRRQVPGRTSCPLRGLPFPRQ